MIGFDEVKAQELCNNLLKVNEGIEVVKISLDIERSGLDLEYETICFIMKRFFDKMMFFYDIIDERKFRKIEFTGSEIILTKH